MSKLYILGTGNAMVTKCFNTCFTITNENGDHILIDTGGGNTILSQLEKLNISTSKIKALFISHTHNDHITGISWIVRMIALQMNKGTYVDSFSIYGEDSVLDACRTICNLTLGKKFTKYFDDRIKFIPVTNNSSINILNNSFTFFDINSTKLKQFGFKIVTQSGTSLCFLGDEPYKDSLKDYAKDVDFLMHEAFCLYEERDLFNPYEKHHSTVKEACEHSVALNSKNLILFHTEDKNIKHRKEYYTAEANYFCVCNVIVPNDLEIIDLDE